MLPACPACVTVLPNSFVDGLDGRTVIPGYNGEPRIKCLSSGAFQVAQTVTGGCPGGCRPVGPNGFSIVGLPDPPTYPDGEETIIPDGSGWPPSWWPTQVVQPSVFQPGIPSADPPWATTPSTTPPAPDPGESETEYLDRCTSALMAGGIDETTAETQCQAAWDTANP